MKIIKIVLTVLFCFLFLASCARNIDGRNAEKPNQLQSKERIEAERELDYNAEMAEEQQFFSMEAFETALKESRAVRSQSNHAKEIEDPAALRELKSYYVPEQVPDGYVFGKMNVHRREISYYYYAEDDLAKDMSFMELDAKGAYYQFRHLRFVVFPETGPGTKYATKEEYVLKTFGGEDAVLVDDRYICEAGRCFWIENGEVICLKVPKGMNLPIKDLSAVCSVEVNTVE